MYSFAAVKGIFAIGFATGFLFSVWFLDRLYKQSFKKYSEEIYYQYKRLLNKKEK